MDTDGHRWGVETPKFKLQNPGKFQVPKSNAGSKGKGQSGYIGKVEKTKMPK
jgi:hypothetical protein